jgi:two-component system phosphate regulon sensor histidine kinase PhoR
MVLTIGAIVLFQVYWLHKSYAEESKLFDLRAHILFRETLFKLQANKLHLDTSFNIRVAGSTGVMNMVNVVQRSVTMDSVGKQRHSVFLRVGGNIRDAVPDPDSALPRMFYRTPRARVADFLSGVDSLQDSVTVKDVNTRFKQVLAREGIHVPFTVTVTAADKKKDILFPDSVGDPVVMGFSNPLLYQLHLGDTFWLTTRRLGPQILISLALVGVTIFSFLLLYRNWRQQQKLTILKNDFISNITHELKTPIATVSVAVEALKAFDALKDPVRTQEYLEISTHELQRLSLLVDKVLKLSLFEKQEIELSKDDFDMKVLVTDVMDSMRLQFEKSQAKVDMVAAEDEQFGLRADKVHFTSVIYNLLDNALKYSTLNPILRVDLTTEQGHLVLAVTDNGIGIPMDYQGRIFEKFFRVPMGDRHNVKGYGLGLSYVAYVVQRHGGEISVHSEEGQGSRFTIKIPRDHG